MWRQTIIRILAFGITGFGVVGCESNAGTGALVGGTAGAGIGAIIGHNSHGRTGSGALIGGAVGAASGAIVGNEVDRQQAEQRFAERDYDGYPPDRVVVQEYPAYGPPPPRYEVVTVRPYYGAVWVNGFWVRRPHAWIWHHGYWR